MASEIKESSLDALFEKLHTLMKNLVRDIDSVLEDNKEMGLKDVKDIRDHINLKLAKSEEIQDNQKILRLLNLFSEDKAVIEIIREDSEEWVELLESIEQNLKEKGVDLTPKERREIEQINRLTSEIKGLLR